MIHTKNHRETARTLSLTGRHRNLMQFCEEMLPLLKPFGHLHVDLAHVLKDSGEKSPETFKNYAAKLISRLRRSKPLWSTCCCSRDAIVETNDDG